MLPEKLSTDLTSLNYHEDRPAMIIEMVVGGGGVIQGSNIYRARVCNQAKLAYNSVAAWLEERGPMPEAVAAVPGLADNLRLQDRVAQQLKALRHEHGALDLQTLEARPVFVGDKIKDLQADERNRAKEIIEDFMIAANGVTARFLHGKKVASLRRMVRSPKRWERIVTKSAAALLLSSRIGDRFDAICTGAADKGTWVRIFNPPIEGRLLYGVEGVDVGHRLRVQLIRTDVEKGYIDFKKVQ